MSTGANSPVRCARRLRRNSGFTLLELLVAVAILAALVTLIPRSFVSARAAIDRSQDWLEARLVAEAVLSGELADRNLRPGTRRGTMDGHGWVAVIVPSRFMTGQPEGTDRALLEVRLAVSVAGAATLDVETTRIGLGR